MGEVISEEPPEPRILFKTNIVEEVISEQPQSFGTISGVVDGNIVQVVADDDLPGGKAIRVATGTDSETSVSIVSPRFDIGSHDPETIVIDYQVQWIEGSQTWGQYLYMNNAANSNQISTILIHSSGILIWNAPMAGEEYRTMQLSPLDEGWNTVRMVANRTTGKASLYLNDLDTPLATDLPFQRSVDSWGDMFIRITHEARKGESRDALYGEIIVTAID